MPQTAAASGVPRREAQCCAGAEHRGRDGAFHRRQRARSRTHHRRRQRQQNNTNGKQDPGKSVSSLLESRRLCLGCDVLVAIRLAPSRRACSLPAFGHGATSYGCSMARHTGAHSVSATRDTLATPVRGCFTSSVLRSRCNVSEIFDICALTALCNRASRQTSYPGTSIYRGTSSEKRYNLATHHRG